MNRGALRRRATNGSSPSPTRQARILASVGRITRRALHRSRVRVFAAVTSLDDVALGARALIGITGVVLGMRLAPEGRAPLGVIVGAWASQQVATFLDQRTTGEAERAVTREMPYVLERLATALRTGRALDSAIGLAAPSAVGPLATAMRDAVKVAELGGSRSDVLDRLGQAPGEAVARTVRALRRGDRLGVPIAVTVEALAADLRARARAAAETDARTAPVRMLFPLAFCFLPAFVLLTIAPIAIEALRSLGGV